MLDGATVRLGGNHTRLVACKLVQEAPDGWLVKIGKPPRTLEQSSKFWTICTSVAKSEIQWGGTTHDKQGWHDLFLSGWSIVKDRPPRLLLGLEGERVALVQHTRWMSKEDVSDLIDYADAWCAVRSIGGR